MPAPKPMAFPSPKRNIWENIQIVLNTDMSFEEFVHMDDAVEASRQMTDEEIVERVMKENEDANNVQEILGEDPDIMDDNSGDTESESGEANESEIISTSTQFLRILAQSKAFILCNNLDPKAIEALDKVENVVIASKVKTSRHQTNIKSFFSI